jgi:hypothetical protein
MKAAEVNARIKEVRDRANSGRGVVTNNERPARRTSRAGHSNVSTGTAMTSAQVLG